jgi:hypothetical protein
LLPTLKKLYKKEAKLTEINLLNIVQNFSSTRKAPRRLIKCPLATNCIKQ